MQIHERVAWQLLADEVVLIDLRGGQAVGLNETGTFLWTRLEGCDEAGLVRALCDEFAVEESRAREDVARFLGFLRERGFVAE